MVSVSWTAGLDVDIGESTKASDYDDLADNAEYVQELADVEHDFDVSTGDGSHGDITFHAGATPSIGESGDAMVMPVASLRMANIPCVLAIPTGTLSDVTGDGTEYTVVFGTEIFDQGSNFSSTTFTAPVTGRYLVSFGLRLGDVGSSHTDCNMSIVTSNRSYLMVAIDSYAVAKGSTLVIGGSSLVDMDAADTLTITVKVSGGTKVVDVFGSDPQSRLSICMVA